MGRKKGEGYILKRGAVFYLLYSVSGKRKWVSLKTSNRKEAEKKAKELLEPAAQVKTKEAVIFHIAEAKKLISAGSLPLAEAWPEYLKSPARPDSSLGTLGNYKRHWENFCGWLRGSHPEITKLSEISIDTATEYAVCLGDKNISSNTFNYHVKSLALITRVLMKKAGLNNNPWAKENISRQAEIKQRRRAFTPAQVTAIFEAFRNENLKVTHKEEMEILFSLGAYTGLRLIDAALVRWEYIDMTQNIISVVPEKTRRIQRRVNIPIHPKLKTLLEYAENWRDGNGYILPKVAARYNQNPDGVKKDCVSILEFCGLSDRGNGRGRSRRLYGFHSFRHFFATTCANSGVPVSTLAEILGDNITTLNKYYVHAEEAHRVKIINALDIGNIKALPHVSGQALPHALERKKERLIKMVRECLDAQKITECMGILED